MKTRVRGASVGGFLKRVPNATRRADAMAILKMLRAVTRKTPKMWGPSIVGFDEHRYTYASGREGVMPLLAFSPRGPATVVYGLGSTSAADLKKLGRHSKGKGCVYIPTLADADSAVLKQLMVKAYRRAKAKRAQP